jgi:hypothetical protein
VLLDGSDGLVCAIGSHGHSCDSFIYGHLSRALIRTNLDHLSATDEKRSIVDVVSKLDEAVEWMEDEGAGAKHIKVCLPANLALLRSLTAKLNTTTATLSKEQLDAIKKNAGLIGWTADAEVES